MVALAMALCACAPAAARVRPADRAATHAYLLAEYEYDQVLLAAQPTQDAVVDAAASQVGTECSGVLAGAPRSSFLRTTPPRVAPSPRQIGEENRLQTQTSALETELRSTLSFAAGQPTREAESKFASKLRGLRWSDRVLTRLIHYEGGLLEQEVRAVRPPVCADMRAWVASGYKILAPASKLLFEREEDELVRLLLLYVPELLLRGTARFNGPAENALERRLDELRSRVSEARSHERAAYAKALSAVGLTPMQDKPERLPRKVTPPREIGRGTTASGTRYSVWLRDGGTGHCRANVEVREGGRTDAGDCIPGFGVQHPTVRCVDGLLTVELVTGARARSVELRLSDGSQIASRPIRVPLRTGGPRGLYYQQVRGPAPVPVALVEVGARGRRLRVFKLEPLSGCTKHPFKYLPGGFRVLARGRQPRGPRFAIVAEHYRLFGVVHFKMRIAENATELRRTREPQGPFEEMFEGEEEGEAGEAVPGKPGRFVPVPFQSHVESGCHPYEHSLVYGLLKSRRDRVFVMVDGQIHKLRVVPIPADMHGGGDALAYGAFPSSPEELIVHLPGGRIVREDRRSEAKGQREMCEGEAEGSGPTVGRDHGGAISIGG